MKDKVIGIIVLLCIFFMAPTIIKIIIIIFGILYLINTIIERNEIYEVKNSEILGLEGMTIGEAIDGYIDNYNKEGLELKCKWELEKKLITCTLSAPIMDDNNEEIIGIIKFSLCKYGSGIEIKEVNNKSQTLGEKELLMFIESMYEYAGYDLKDSSRYINGYLANDNRLVSPNYIYKRDEIKKSENKSMITSDDKDIKIVKNAEFIDLEGITIGIAIEKITQILGTTSKWNKSTVFEYTIINCEFYLSDKSPVNIYFKVYDKNKVEIVKVIVGDQSIDKKEEIACSIITLCRDIGYNSLDNFDGFYNTYINKSQYAICKSQL